MDSTRAMNLLQECEKGLRQLVSAAAAAGDYGGIIKLTSWARVLGGLVQDAKTERGSAKSSLAPVQAEVARQSPIGRRGTSQLRSSKVSRHGSGYPRFFRHAGDLLKIGWSKRERTEYHHKAPQAVVMQLVSKLAVTGAGGAIFTADDIFPLGADEGSPVPNYQGYLCLAWLRREGLVQAHGRQGYSVVNGENLSSAVTSHWNGLQSYSG